MWTGERRLHSSDCGPARQGGEGADQLLAAGADSQTVDTSAKTENNHNSLLKDKCSL